MVTADRARLGPVEIERWMAPRMGETLQGEMTKAGCGEKPPAVVESQG